MLLPITVGSIWRLVFYCWEPADQQLGVNVMHYKCTVVTGGGALTSDLVDQMSTYAGSRYRAYLSSQAQYWGAAIYKPTSPGPPPDTSSNGRGAGAGSGGLVPTVAAPVISFRTAIGGRSGRGRAYMPFLTGNSIGVDGQLTTTSAAYFASMFADLRVPPVIAGAGGGDSVNVVQVIYHRATDTADAVTTLNVTGKIGRQKRRGDYGRKNSAPVL